MLISIVIACAKPPATEPTPVFDEELRVEAFDRLEAPLVQVAAARYELPATLSIGDHSIGEIDGFRQLLNRVLTKQEPLEVRLGLQAAPRTTSFGDPLRGAALVVWSDTEIRSEPTLVDANDRWIRFQPGGHEPTGASSAPTSRDWTVDERLLHPDAGQVIGDPWFLGQHDEAPPESLAVTVPAEIEGAEWARIDGTDARWKLSVEVTGLTLDLKVGERSLSIPGASEPGSMAGTVLPAGLQRGENIVELSWAEPTHDSPKVAVDLVFDDGIDGPWSRWDAERRVEVLRSDEGQSTRRVRIVVE